MSERCKANPCCGEVVCAGIPLPQDPSGLVGYNSEFEREIKEGATNARMARKIRSDAVDGAAKAVETVCGPSYHECKADNCCGANPCDSLPATVEPKTLGQILDGVDNATVKLGDAFMSAALAFADDLKEMKDALGSMDESEARMILAHFERKADAIGTKINEAMEAAFA